MNVLDLLLVLFAASAATGGYRLGFLARFHHQHHFPGLLFPRYRRRLFRFFDCRGRLLFGLFQRLCRLGLPPAQP